MGYNPVSGVGTYGRKCLDGTQRQFLWWQRVYSAGSLGCYNPASVAGGGPSLHAEGRAMDIALNANNPAEMARGDAIFARVMARPTDFGAQEMLWRGYIWSWNRRGEGKRGPGVQQSAHMNHVHLGIDVNAAQNWNDSWVGFDGLYPPTEEDDLPYEVEEIVQMVNNGVERALEPPNNVDPEKKARQYVYDIARGAIRDELMARGGSTEGQTAFLDLVERAVVATGAEGAEYPTPRDPRDL